MKGLLFQAESVRQILAGAKTQTRRVMRPQPVMERGLLWWRWSKHYGCARDDRPGEPSDEWLAHAPYRVDESVCVKETWAPADVLFDGVERDPAQCIAYRADQTARYCQNSLTERWVDADTRNWGWSHLKWRSPLMMPAWASRVQLRIERVRVERVDAISEEDARAEGFDPVPAHGEWAGPRETGGHWSARKAFHDAWIAMHGAESWGRDWVWVYDFVREEKSKYVIAIPSLRSPPAESRRER